MTDPHDPTDPEAAPTPRLVITPASWRYRALMALAVAVAFGALYAGVRATTTDSDRPMTVNGRPEVVEHLYPRNGASVLRQSEIGIDLISGYEATLVINGVEIPVDEQRIVPEQNQVFFTPGPGKAIEVLPASTTCVTAVAWRTADGRGVNDLSYRWCFDVT